MAKSTSCVYLIVYNHELGVDIDLKSPVLLRILVRATRRRRNRRFELPFPERLFVACTTSTL